MSVGKHYKYEIPVSRGIKPKHWERRGLHRAPLISFFSAGEDPCWAQPFLCTLPPPLSMATLVEACTQNKEVIKMPITFSLFLCTGLIFLFSKATETVSHYAVWFVWIQAEDGLSKCSSEPSWSQPWCAGLPSSSTSSLSTTTPPEPSPLAPWWVWHNTSLRVRTNIVGVHSFCLSVWLCCGVVKVIWRRIISHRADRELK